jgi:ELWxxDGT repeat protein
MLKPRQPARLVVLPILWLATVCLIGRPGAVLASGRAHLVKDIVTSERGSDPRDFAELNGTLYFVARDGPQGEELWKSDGTASGTVSIKVLGPQHSFGTSYRLTRVGNLLFLAVGSNGGVLWRSDGTTRGTFPIGTFGEVTEFVDVGGALFFGAYGSEGAALWKSDGSETGTMRIRSFGSLPQHLTAVGSTLFFNGGNGELWRSDGSENGTVRVKRVDFGPYDAASPFDLADVNGTLFFFTNGERGTDLWKSDGSEGGTIRVRECVRDEQRGSGVGPRIALGDTLVFPGSDAQHGTELWRSDGTPEGTDLIADLKPGPASSQPGGFVALGDRIFFTASDSTGYGLWTSDLTDAGSVLLKRASDGVRYWNLEYVSNGTQLIFSLTCASQCRERELWKSDGTPGGTVFIRSFQEVEFGLAAAGGRAFLAATSENIGRELWTSDGTEAGTVLVKNINRGTHDAFRISSSGSMASLGEWLFFTVDDPDYASPGFYDFTDIWRTDGTEAGTIQISAHELMGPATPTDLVALGDRLVFFAGSQAEPQLWATDGTSEGMTLLAAWTSISGPPALFGDALFFAAADASHGMELWRTDGSPDGTTPVRDINPGPAGSEPRMITRAGDRLYFVTGTVLTGQALWTSDGSESGTVLVEEFAHKMPTLEQLTGVGERLFFFSSGDLWVSDGSRAGTRQIGGFVDEWIDVDRRPPIPNRPSRLTDVDGTLFFVADDGEHGRELWKSDGTIAGTTLVKDILPGAASRFSGPEELTSVGSTLFFVADDGVSGPEIWKSDGTEGGTVLVKDAVPGPLGASAFGLTNVHGILLFATRSDDGVRLWRSDGTEPGTFVLIGARAAPFQSLGWYTWQFPTFLPAGPNIFFLADDHVHGMELWAMPAGALHARACAGDCDGDGAVNLGELVAAVNVALGRVQLQGCAASDCNGDGEIRIEELTSAVRNALRGCP